MRPHPSSASASTSTPGKRLFVALWPPPPLQRALTALTDGERSGVAVPAANVHLTLAFLGASSNEQEACYRAALQKLSFDAFKLRIDMLGWWRKPRIVWAGPSETPSELPALVQQVNELLRACPAPSDTSGNAAEKESGTSSFAAHITLLRKHPGPAPAWGGRTALSWRVDTVALWESLRVAGGVRYRPLLRIGAQTTG